MNKSGQDGELFETHVAELLRMAGYDVRGETLVGYKKGDLCYTVPRIGKVYRGVVECKAHSRKLTQAELTSIYANYLPLYAANDVDEILVVTQKGLVATAETMVRKTRGLIHITAAELEANIIDFGPYLRWLITDFASDGLADYYIRPKTTDGADLENVVSDWAANGGASPLAMLGSYGSGKTSFARYLASIYAASALERYGNRIPVLLSLGDTASERSLEGFLGAAFTATHEVPRYRFSSFMALNRMGRFIIFLDGFDEMKHAMDWEAFRSNFEQLNRLVVPNSRVILLGRPSAFLSEDEERHVLQGERWLGSQVVRDDDWPSFQRVTVGPFDEGQAREFFTKYAERAKRTGSPSGAGLGHSLEEVLAGHATRAVADRLFDLARRPVHLRMLAEVLPQFKGTLDALNEVLLYDRFIDQTIEREMGKPSRRGLTKKERRRFAEDLALWMWRNRQAMYLSAAEIPDEILGPYARNSTDLDAVRRDLVAACPLESKTGGSLYFPHRSLQEFLVAEAVLRDAATGVVPISELNRIVTPEVAAFICGLAGLGSLTKLAAALATYRGPLTGVLADLWLSKPEFIQWMISQMRTTQTPWYPLLLTIGTLRSASPELERDQLCRLLLDSMRPLHPRSNPDERYLLLCYLCIALVSGESPRLLEALQRLCKCGRVETVSTGMQPSERGGHDRVEVRRIVLTPLVAKLFGNIQLTQGAYRLTETYRFLCRVLWDYCILADWVRNGRLEPPNTDLPRTLERGRPRPGDLLNLYMTTLTHEVREHVADAGWVKEQERGTRRHEENVRRRRIRGGASKPKSPKAEQE